MKRTIFALATIAALAFGLLGTAVTSHAQTGFDQIIENASGLFWCTGGTAIFRDNQGNVNWNALCPSTAGASQVWVGGVAQVAAPVATYSAPVTYSTPTYLSPAVSYAGGQCVGGSYLGQYGCTSAVSYVPVAVSPCANVYGSYASNFGYPYSGGYSNPFGYTGASGCGSSWGSGCLGGGIGCNGCVTFRCGAGAFPRSGGRDRDCPTSQHEVFPRTTPPTCVAN